MPLSPGQRLEPYEIIAPLAEGGMGEVYRARDTRLNRDVAIKVLPDLFAADPDRLARLTREAQMLAALNHPNIAQIYGVVDHPAALVMEFADGEDLSTIIARGPIPIPDTRAIARQIADALEAAHEQGIVHRDLKPANIKVRADGTVKVLDFGLAKAMDPVSGAAPEGPARTAANSPTLTARATALGIIIGTAAYMAPEQARGKAVDRRADVWAFGVVLFEMLTGRRAFAGETISDVMSSVMKDEPDLAAVPVPWRRLIGRCLDKDPRTRLRDIGDVWLLLEGDGSAERAPASARQMWAWIAAALVAGAAVGWIAFAIGRPAATARPVTFLEAPAAGTKFVAAPMPSPDGRRLAWIAADAAGMTRLWTREIGEAAARVLAGTDGADGAFWSPDSTQLAFVAGGKVQRIAADGGAVSLVVAADPRSAVWLPDNDLLLAVTGEGLLRVPATGGARRPANGFTAESFRTLQIDGLSVSPDGRCILFTQFGGETGIYAVRPDGTGKRLLYPGEQSQAVFVGNDMIVRENARVLMAQRFAAADLSLVGEAFPVVQNVGASDFTGAGGVLTFIAGASATSRLIWFTRDGKDAGVAAPEGEFTEVGISRGGHWLGFARRDRTEGNVDVWLQALPAGAPSRFTTDPDIDHLLAISHDERDVAWEAHAKGALNLMRRPVDGSAAAQLVRPWGKAGGPDDWSPDGRFVLYSSDDGPGGSNLWAVPMGGSGEPIRMTQPGFGATNGQFSPDGRWLAFLGDATGSREVYVQRVEGTKLVGGPVRVSPNGGARPLWRRDGAELFYINNGTIMAADFHGQDDRPAGVPHALFMIAALRNAPFVFGRAYAVTPDGQQFVAIVSQAEETAHPATVMLNWRDTSNQR